MTDKTVSPELMLRPSLSGQRQRDTRQGAKPVSPELMLRPSLSDDHGYDPLVLGRRVAGAYAPAFVERRIACGIHSGCCGVSPELMLRPSLSGDRIRRPHGGHDRVAGAYAPAFVERPKTRFRSR